MTKTKVLPPSMESLRSPTKHPALLDDESGPFIVDHNNNDCVPSLKKSCDHGPRRMASISFKYNSLANREDINDLRQMLTRLRAEQMSTIGKEEYEFYEADYMRMMVDDWLVTRFLLRGKKAFEREAEYGEQEQESCVADNTDDETSQVDLLKATRRADDRRRAILSRTIELVKVCAKFRFDYRINNRTRLDEFPAEWLATDGLFNYKPDASGNPTIHLRVAMHRPKLIESPEARHLFKRFMLYNLERCDQDLYNKPGKAICCVFDMTNVAFENIDLELTTWMIKSFKSSSPKLICYVIIYNPPWFFTATFKLICNTLLSNSKRQSIRFVSGNEILNYIDCANLPPHIRSAIH
jgi:hypothetical protein